MTPEFARDAHRLEVPYHNGTVNAPGGKVVALAIEAHTCRMPRPYSVGYVLGVVLKEVIVGQEEIHFRVRVELLRQANSRLGIGERDVETLES